MTSAVVLNPGSTLPTASDSIGWRWDSPVWPVDVCRIRCGGWVLYLRSRDSRVCSYGDKGVFPTKDGNVYAFANRLEARPSIVRILPDLRGDPEFGTAAFCNPCPHHPAGAVNTPDGGVLSTPGDGVHFRVLLAGSRIGGGLIKLDRWGGQDGSFVRSLYTSGNCSLRTVEIHYLQPVRGPISGPGSESPVWLSWLACRGTKPAPTDLRRMILPNGFRGRFILGNDALIGLLGICWPRICYLP